MVRIEIKTWDLAVPNFDDFWVEKTFSSSVTMGRKLSPEVGRDQPPEVGRKLHGVMPQSSGPATVTCPGREKSF